MTSAMTYLFCFNLCRPGKENTLIIGNWVWYQSCLRLQQFPLTRANQVFHEGSIVKLLSIKESIIIESLVIRQQAMHNNGKVNGA